MTTVWVVVVVPCSAMSGYILHLQNHATGTDQKSPEISLIVTW
jgi:hypothetical protein